MSGTTHGDHINYAALADLDLEGRQLEARILNGSHLSEAMVREYLRLHEQAINVRTIDLFRSILRLKLDGLTRQQLLGWLRTLRRITVRLAESPLKSVLTAA